MLSHPWMKLDLSGKENLAVSKQALSKYVSVRKEQSQRFKAEQGNDDDDEN
jgi:hypothetical protein